MKQIIIIMVLLFGFVGTVEAGKYRAIRHGRVVVAHTRVLPVVAHRVLPPYRGRHVYARPYYVAPMPVIPIIAAPVMIYRPPVIVQPYYPAYYPTYYPTYVLPY